MYPEFFRKEITVAETMPVSLGMMNDSRIFSDFLARQGYREIRVSGTIVKAIRGNKIWNLINIGDPRRNYHSIEISVAPEVIALRIHIDTWYGLGTKYDKAVFAAENEMLKHFLQTKEISHAPLQKAQSLRRKSDMRTFLIIVGTGILISVVAIAMYGVLPLPM